MAIEALILAEGGTGRLKPLTDHVPTSVVPVGGTSILDHQIQALRSVDIGTITVIGGYRGAQVEQICRAYPSVRFCLNTRFHREDPGPEAVRLAGLVPRDELIVLRGDLLFDPELVRGLTSRGAGDCVVVDEDRAPIGLWKVSAATFDALLADPAAAGLGEEPSLYGSLARVLERSGAAEISPNGHSWVCVESLESLARALRVQRRIGEAKVLRTRLRLEIADPAPTASRWIGLPGSVNGDSGPATPAAKHAA